MLEIQKKIHALYNPERAKQALRFFKTGKGEYGEGDKFLGLSVPQCRAIVKTYRDSSRSEITTLLRSPYHEERLVALIIMVDQYRRGSALQKETLYRLYLKSTKYINNWDLVDTSASNIVGVHLLNKSKGILKTLAHSKSVWDRRIAMISTLVFIVEGQFDATLQIATLLLYDEHDLIHKAVGWMLREVGKRSRPTLVGFLDKHAQEMPRTMLRYSIERFPEKKRKRYLLLKNV